MKPDAKGARKSASISRIRVWGIIAACVLLLLGLASCRKRQDPPTAVSPEGIESHRGTTTKLAEYTDSADLKQTSVVATLDCPLPEHKNVIWCATFQMAWNKLKDDVIHEPVSVLGAEELAARLNQAKVSAGDLEEGSFYVTAGFVHEGILERIQKEMAKHFPSEPPPVFDERHKTPLPTIVVYSYLNVDVGFKYPFYSNNYPFRFEDSNGTRTDVTSFCAHTELPHPDLARVREQVDILYYKYGDRLDTAEFVVDLCRNTHPYQIVGACMPRQTTLNQAVTAVEQKVSEFKHDPNYGILRQLRSIDTLIVPDVLYRLTHHFAELEGKWIGERPSEKIQIEKYLIFEARQTIDFVLSRTGVILQSEARLGAAGGAGPPPRRQGPRYLCFSRPFLIYVKKRDAGTRPFFVMWVDNAELMKKAEGSRL